MQCVTIDVPGAGQDVRANCAVPVEVADADPGILEVGGVVRFVFVVSHLPRISPLQLHYSMTRSITKGITKEAIWS